MKRFRLCLVGAAALSLCGCGGGGGGNLDLGVPSASTLTRAQQQIGALASGGVQTSTQSLQAALDLFTQSLQQDPNSPDAAFGSAIALAGLLSLNDDPLDLPPAAPFPPTVGTGNGGPDDPPPAPPSSKSTARRRDVVQLPPPSVLGEGLSAPPTPPGVPTPTPLPPPSSLGLIWNLNRGVGNPDLLLHVLAPVVDFQNGYLPFFPGQNGTQEVARRQKLLTDLTTVSQYLEKVEADPSFTFTLSGGSNGQTRVLGLPEVYLFDAYVQSQRVKVALSLAYVREGTTAQPLQPIPALAQGGSVNVSGSGSSGGAVGGTVVSGYTLLDTNHDGKLTPDEYLAPSPFLTLRDAAYLQTAQQALLATADKESKGIDGVFARASDNKTFLVPNTTQVHALLAQVQNTVLPLIKQAATGPVTIQEPYVLVGTTELPPAAPDSGTTGVPTVPPQIIQQSVTIDLAAWFAKPPQDLKAFAPTYTLTTQGWIDPTKTVYPDPTFGGLFPNGLAKHGAL